MRTHLATLLLILPIKTNIVHATKLSLRELLSLSQPTSKASIHSVDINHLECQLNLSRERQRFEELQERAQSISDSCNRDLRVMNKKTLAIFIQVHKDLTKSERRSYHAQLSDWIPTLLTSTIELFLPLDYKISPIKRFIGQTFLDDLRYAESKAWLLAYIVEHDMSNSYLTLKAYCEGTLAPCMGDDAFVSRKQSSVELKACSKIEGLEDLAQTAEAWRMMASNIHETRRFFNWLWNLVKEAQAQEQKSAEEWIANVVAK